MYRTFLIGDSITKGIQARGMNNKTDINLCSGATIALFNDRLTEIGTNNYLDIVLYIGGNDASNGTSNDTLRAEIRKTTLSLQRKQCRVYLCTMCPRRDVDVRPFKNEIRELCRETGAVLIECDNAFIYCTTVRHFYNNDGIHLNQYGTKMVFNINKRLQIVKTPRNEETFDDYAGRQYSIQHFADDRGQRSDHGYRNNFTPVNRRSRQFEMSPRNSHAASAGRRSSENVYTFNHASGDCRRRR